MPVRSAEISEEVQTLTNSRHLASLDPVEAFREVDRVSEGDFLSVGKIDILGTLSVERESTLGVLRKNIRALGVLGLDSLLAVLGNVVCVIC